MKTITREELMELDVTIQMAQSWALFYKAVWEANPQNPSARGRMILMEYCASLLFEG